MLRQCAMQGQIKKSFARTSAFGTIGNMQGVVGLENFGKIMGVCSGSGCILSQPYAATHLVP